MEIDLDKITRLTVVDYTVPYGEGGGRVLELCDRQLELAIQDGGRTLKIFLRGNDGAI